MATTPVITMPAYPVLGTPPGEKDSGQRVDFKPTKFDLLIEQKGYLVSWTRACECPCAPVVEQTENPDPNCPLCKGRRWIYFGGNTEQDLSEYVFTNIQKKIVDDAGAMVIKGLITGIGSQADPWERMGSWVSGTMNLTVRHENKLAYYDKLTILDSEIGYSEILEADGTQYLSARYLMTGINYLRSVSTVFIPDTDYRLLDDGRIQWIATPPASGTRLAVHYLCHPTFLVIEHPHVIRTTQQLFKTSTPKTPLGDPRSLPIQTLMRYDFLPEREVDAE